MITTPKGIAIPLPLDQTFCMMARLTPRIKPYTVLETTAGFYNMHSLTALITGVVCFLLRLPLWQIAALTFSFTLIGYFMSVFAIYPPGFLRLARIYSTLKGIGLFLIGVSILGFFTVGPIGTIVFWSARLLAEFVTMAHANRLGMLFLRGTQPDVYELLKKSSVRVSPDGFAIRSFGNAYASFASRMNVPLDAFASESELESWEWRIVLDDFAQEWPEVVRRFQVTAEEWKEALPHR